MSIAGIAYFFHLLSVHRVPALVKNRAEDFRMERFNPAVEQRRKAGQVADVARRDAALFEKRLGAAGRVDDAPRCDERASQIVRTVLVRERKQRGSDGFPSRQSRLPARTSVRRTRSSSRPVRAS